MTSFFSVTGGVPLKGTLTVQGAKNSVLPILAATLLSDAPFEISRVPALEDVGCMQRLLSALGKSMQVEEDVYRLAEQSACVSTEIARDLASKMRASILLLGPLLARHHQVRIPLPGGCAIGTRPVDQHIQGLRALGAHIEFEQGDILARAPGGLRGGHYRFSVVTVTGTENVIMAACLAQGTTVLENCAREPEVLDLCHFLQKMGAQIEGIGTERLVIEGRQQLLGCQHAIIGDRIVAMTYLVAAAMTRGDVTVQGIDPTYIAYPLDILKTMGAQVHYGPDWVRVCAEHPLRAQTLETQPYPGFPTDLQAQFMALNTIALGESAMRETIFENRLMHVPGLQAMGAKIRIEENVAFVEGVASLHAAHVQARDLRAGAGLVLAALVAQGSSRIDGLEHLDRGYAHFEQDLRHLGADIERCVECSQVAREKSFEVMHAS